MLHNIRSICLRALKAPIHNRRWRIAVLAVVGCFIALNAVLYVAYQQRTYPTASITGRHIGSVASSDLEAVLGKQPLLAKEVVLVHGKTTAKVATNRLGIAADYRRLAGNAMRDRSWLPVANLIGSRDQQLVLDVKPAVLGKSLSAALQPFAKPAANAKLEYRDGKFEVVDDNAGQTADLEATQRRLIESLRQGEDQITVTVKPLPATVTADQLKSRTSELNKQLQAGVSIEYAGQAKRFGPNEISQWYVPDGGGTDMVLSDEAIRQAVNQTGSGFGIRVSNLDAAVGAVKAAILQPTAGTVATVTLEAAPVGKLLRYCVASRGVDQSQLAELATKLSSTFSDSRGWGLEGLVRFELATAGCDFTVWLSAAEHMPSFGAICDSQWSCAVAPNVIINYDRWRFASEAWNAQGGSLDDYRSMVINHETGHWFGMYHAHCGGAGQPAPVMQQQSINLQGCSFNPWPTAGERANLKARLGL